MAVTNFFPEIWATGILKERDKVMVAAKHCNTDYEGQIRQKGDRVKILTVGDVASYPYTRNADIQAPDQLADEAQWLDIDQAKYCHVALDDVDKAQSNANLMSEAQRKLGIKMADDVDSYIFGLHTKISAAQKIDGTSGITSKTVFNTLAQIRQKFKEANVPNSETIYLEVSPAVYAKFVIARIAQDTDNSKVIDNGEVAKRLYGIEVHESNNIVKVGDNYKCFARTKAAISYASQLTETVAYRPERRFGDAIKSLQVWGAKIIRPKELFLFDAKIGAEQ
ncbi:MAG: hypothetical protein GX111_00305 [Clostridiales bacterium]|jgi:hypothetical protein|nr:hypothetical protein [Clostridiales bacterium]